MGVQVDSSGKVHYIDSEGDSGSTWDYLTKHLPRAVGQTFGEAITPSLNAVGQGGQGDDVESGRQWLHRNLGLTNRGGEGLLEAGLKGAGEGLLNLVVPESSADLEGAVLGEASGALLGGGLQARRAVQEALAAREAQNAARQSATTKLQEAARKPADVWQGPEGGGTPPGYHTQRMAQRNRNLNELPGESPYRGPRPTNREFERYQRGTGEGAGIPDEARAGTTSPVGQAARASDVANAASVSRQGSHQLHMQRYRAGQEAVRELLQKEGRLPTPEEIAKIQDPVARQAAEEFVKNQGTVARDLQEGRQIGQELGDRREIAGELAQRREIQRELQDRREIGNELAPTQTAPTQPSPQPPTNRTATMPETTGPTARDVRETMARTQPPQEGPNTMTNWLERQNAPTQPVAPPPPPTQPMGRTPTQGGIGDVARQEAARRASRGTPPPADFEANQRLMDQNTRSQIEQINQLENLPDYGHWRINALMQQLFRDNPNMTLEQFLELMRKGGGEYGAPPLPF